MDPRYIENDLYLKIVENMPIPCVDLLVIAEDKFVLGKRVNEPGKGEWYPLGGRVYKKETLLDAVVRKMKEELGLTIKTSDATFLTTIESIFEGDTIDKDRHSINAVYVVRFPKIPECSFDKKQSTELKWFSEIDNEWHPYIKKFLTAAGFKYKK